MARCLGFCDITNSLEDNFATYSGAVCVFELGLNQNSCALKCKISHRFFIYFFLFYCLYPDSHPLTLNWITKTKSKGGLFQFVWEKTILQTSLILFDP